MMLDVAIEADAEWDSRTSWEDLVDRAAKAAVAESAFPQLGASVRARGIIRPPDERRGGPALQRPMAAQGQADQRPLLPHGRSL